MAASKIYINFRVYANNLCNKYRNLAPKPGTKLLTFKPTITKIVTTRILEVLYSKYNKSRICI
jgi:hypothetical protein